MRTWRTPFPYSGLDEADVRPASGLSPWREHTPDPRSRGWWERYRGVLLGSYGRAVFDSALPPLPKSEVELRVVQRLQRQQVLDRENPVDYVAYVHEWALRMQFGGHRSTREQLTRLCEASERKHVDVRVLPVEAGAFPGAGHAILYADGAVPQLDTVQLDSAHGGEFTHADSQLAKYGAHMDWWHTHTLGPQDSRDLIHAIAQQL